MRQRGDDPVLPESQRRLSRLVAVAVSQHLFKMCVCRSQIAERVEADAPPQRGFQPSRPIVQLRRQLDEPPRQFKARAWSSARTR